MNQKTNPEAGGRRSIRSRFHNWWLLMQFDSCDKGIAVVHKNGDHIVLIHEPRRGEYTWETAAGPIDSDMIAAVIDRSAYGYS